MKRRLLRAAIVLGVLAVGGTIAIAVPRLPERGTTLPTSRISPAALSSLTVYAKGIFGRGAHRRWSHRRSAAYFASFAW